MATSPSMPAPGVVQAGVSFASTSTIPAPGWHRRSEVIA